MGKTCGIIIQARMGSTRLPGKVLKKIMGKTMLGRVIERAKFSSVKKIALTTTLDEADTALAQLARDMNISVSRQKAGDPLNEYYRAAGKFKIDPVVRITADCPLIDPGIIDKTVNLFSGGSFDYVCTDNSFPDGLDVEVFSFNALRKAYKEAQRSFERMHVTPYIWRRCGGISKPHMENTEKLPKIFSGVMLKNDLGNLFHMRWTVDDERDLDFVRMVYLKLEEPGKIFLMKNVLNLIRAYPGIAEINKNTTRDGGYIKSRNIC